MNFPKIVKLRVPYEFKISNEEAYAYLKETLKVSNLKDLQTRMTERIETYLQENQSDLKKIWNEEEPEVKPLVKPSTTEGHVTHIRKHNPVDNSNKKLPWE